MIRKFEGVTNLFNRFLDDMFEPDPEGWLSLKVVRSCREMWEAKTGYELVNEGGKPLADARLGEAIVKHSTWGVSVMRKVDESGERGWGLKGVRIKRLAHA
jgi:hypothetical protein